MSNAALGAAFVASALVLWPSASAAQGQAATGGDESEAVTLVYVDAAHRRCPTEEEFRAEVTRLTSKARFTTEPGARHIRFELEVRAGELRGRLITGDGKTQATRVVKGRACQEVSSALAIAVALTIDPEALSGGPSEPVAEEPPKSEPAPESKPKVETKPKPKPKPERAAKPTTPPQPLKVLWGLGAGLTLESAWAPHLRAGGHAFLLVGIGERWRLSLGGSRFPIREDDDLSFDAWFGHGSVAYSLALAGSLRPFASLGYEAGAVYAKGSGLSKNVEAQRPWQTLSAGLGLRLETEGLFLQLAGSFLVPISRQRYLISDPNGLLQPAFQVPRFGLKQETSLGVFL
jgi:hypothetical protein